MQEAEAAYDTVMKGLKAKQAELADVLSRLATLEAQLAKSVADKERLEAEVRGLRAEGLGVVRVANGWETRLGPMRCVSHKAKVQGSHP